MGRKRIDWDPIEADYRTGMFTLDRLGRKYGVRPETIWRRMNRRGVTRDMSRHVRSATRAKLVIDAAQRQRALEEAIEDYRSISLRKVRDAVDAAAELGARLVKRHQEAIAQMRETASALTDELIALGEAKRAGLSNETIEQIAVQAGFSQQQVRAVLESASLPVRANVADKLAGVLAKLIPLERKSHGLDEEQDKSTWESDWLKLVEEYKSMHDDGSAA